MSYIIWISEDANHQLQNLPIDVKRLVCHRITTLGENHTPPDAREIFGTEALRIYVLNYYRVIYEIYDGDGIIMILDIRPRYDDGDTLA